MRKQNTPSSHPSISKDVRTFYRQKLPHLYPIGATFFVTFRLQGSLPQGFLKGIELEYEAALHRIKTSNVSNHKELIYNEQKRLFKKYDDGLHKVYNGVDYLKNNQIANLIAKKMKHYDGELYELHSYTIMSNHVHIVFDTSLQLRELEGEVTTDNYVQVDKIMQLIKGGTSYEANQILNRTGKFWQKESYDHYARDFQELRNINFYVIKNAVVAGLVKDWRKHEFTYLSEKCSDWI